MVQRHFAQRDGAFNPHTGDREIVFAELDEAPVEYEWAMTVQERVQYIAEAVEQLDAPLRPLLARLRNLPGDALLYGQCGYSAMRAAAETARLPF